MQQQREHLTHTKPFRLVKYFSFSSFLAVLVFTAVLSAFIIQRAKTVFLRKTEESAHILAANLNHQVFYQFVIPTAMKHGRIQLRNPDQFQLLDRVVRATIHSFKLDEVIIYSTTGVVTYSTRSSLMGSQHALRPEMKSALMGRVASRIISRENGWPVTLFPEEGKLKTYIPFRAEVPLSAELGPVLGVFEITQDLTEDYRSLTSFQFQVVGISIAVMALLFFALRAIVIRAEHIIDRNWQAQKRLEQQLNHAERLASLGEMVAAVSHEIRNPLGIIRSTAELLKRKVEGSGVRLAEVIIEEANRLNGIVTEFLDFARPQVPRLAPCRPRAVLERCLEFLDPEIEKHGITLDAVLLGDAEISADSGLLYRAFLNVLVNAVQAMPEGGHLSVTSTILREGTTLVTIGDTGEGIPEDRARKVWNPFFTTKDKGSGLGLPIVKNIVEAHGGVVEIDSLPGRGTKVIMTFPWGRKG
ncbi:MAG: ATP-binding protein [Pseudomonadota bacterium]